jgi:hypothetical protein
MILAKKPGYEDQQLVLQTKTNSWFWGNILVGGFYGSTTDYASDAMIEYAPNMDYVTLNPVPLVHSQESGVAVERGTRTRIEQVNMRTEQHIRQFILRYHAYLAADIARGQGEYLSSLYTLLHLPESGDTLKTFRGLSTRHHDTLSFADAVLSQYPVDGSEVPSPGSRSHRSPQ